MKKKLYFQSTTTTNKTNKTFKSGLNTKGNDSKSRLSIMSSFTDTKIDNKSNEDPQKILQSLILNYSKTNDKNDINDYCIENSQKDMGFITQMFQMNKQFDDFVFSSPREEGEQNQLVEKNLVDKSRQEKERLLKNINKLTREVKNIDEKLSKAKGENNFVKQAAEYQNRLKSDNAKQIMHMQNMFEECKLQNKLYKEELTLKKIQKDSLMNALTNFIYKYDQDMANELKNLVSIYDNQYYKVSSNGVDEKYIDDLFAQIKVLERKLISKNKEIKYLERQLVLPGDKNNNRKKMMSKNNIKRPRPLTVDKTKIDANPKNRYFTSTKNH